MPFGCKLGLAKVNVQAYADDIILLSPSSGGLRRLIETLGNLIVDADLVVNLEKTVMIFILRVTQWYRSLCSFVRHHYHTRLEIVEECKYLGVFISSKCNDSKVMKQVVDSLNKVFFLWGGGEFRTVPLIFYFTCSECIVYHFLNNLKCGF